MGGPTGGLLLERSGHPEIDAPTAVLFGADPLEPAQADSHDSSTELAPLIHGPPSRRRSSGKEP